MRVLEVYTLPFLPPCVPLLQERGEDAETFYNLSDQVYATARIDPAQNRVRLLLHVSTPVYALTHGV